MGSTIDDHMMEHWHFWDPASRMLPLAKSASNLCMFVVIWSNCSCSLVALSCSTLLEMVPRIASTEADRALFASSSERMRECDATWTSCAAAHRLARGEASARRQKIVSSFAGGRA
jgi:hypothetical protein